MQRVQFLGWEDSPGGGHGNPFQYSCLENPHGQWSLAGLWVRKEADTTEGISTHTKYTMKFAISTTLSV